MMDCGNDYAAHYQWEWCRREEWRGSFRERKRHSSGAFIELVRERGLTACPVLDCSCGLGLKTIVMREAGLNVQGSDQCERAVEVARLLAAEEGHGDIQYFVSSWAELSRRTETRYAAIFNDALSWVYTDHEMATSLKGLHDCMLPGGVLAYMGALPGTRSSHKRILDQEWERKTANGKHWLGARATDGAASMQEVVFLEKGSDFIDEHHLYVVDRAGTIHVETWCLRCSLKWSWARIRRFLEEAGFSSFGVKQFVAENGKPFHLVIATRD